MERGVAIPSDPNVSSAGGAYLTKPVAQGVTVRAATEADIPAIEALIAHFARQNRMLFRTAAELQTD